jgi:hypothetical protein
MSLPCSFTCACLIGACVVAVAAQSGLPVSRAERTNFEETSRYEDVRAFMDWLASQTPRLRIEAFGASEEGRTLPLLVIGDPPAASPQAARASGRPIVFVMANIHAGEVEGKEALQHLARRMTRGDLQALLPTAVWLFAPIYNADGNERISLENRSEQHGPIGGVGTRENANGLDLNRDFMKLESSEARNLVAMMSRWDPDVVVDLHTTNGSYHGYHLTYAPSLNPNSDGRIVAFARERLLPAVSAAMAARHQLRTYYYGNFSTAGALDQEQSQVAVGDGRTPVWRTFDPRPRFGNNYVGLRNRIAILSEAYSYLDFAGRVKATEAFVEEIMRFVAANSGEIRSVVSRADADWVGSGSAADAGVGFELRPLATPVDILVGAVEKKVNPRSGKLMTTMVEAEPTPARMIDYGVFAATRSRRVPREYIVLPSADGLHDRIARKLQDHGIRVDVLSAAARVEVEQLVLDQVRQAERPFEGHRETTVTGRFERRDADVPAGSIVVRTDQPLGRLVFYLLEPESDDGLTAWNMLDAALKSDAPHPVIKGATGQRLQTRPMDRNGGSSGRD